VRTLDGSMPRRIAYVLKVFPKVSETFVASEIAELLRRGVDVRVLSIDRPTEVWHHRFIDDTGLNERIVYDQGAFESTLRTFAPDVIHAHFATEATATARDLAERIGAPFTFTAHGYDIYRRPPVDFSERAAAASAVVTVSTANARHISDTFGVSMSHLSVIPCGVDTDFFRPAQSRAVPPLVACVARLVPVKNHALLLEACALLVRRGIHFRCVLVGDGRSRDDIAALRLRLGLDDVVEIAGAMEQTDVRDCWRRASVGVLASISEGMPVSLMEAAASGVPVVATTVGGVSELVGDGETGLLVASGDAEGLAVALERLLADAPLAERMGAAARRRAEERFSVARAVNDLVNVWGSVLRGRRVQAEVSNVGV
jgi:colanic acid/amylovoran biosynthesis glycosyltransferase